MKTPERCNEAFMKIEVRCDRVPGHKGQHAAHGPDGKLRVRWSHGFGTAPDGGQ